MVKNMTQSFLKTVKFLQTEITFVEAEVTLQSKHTGHESLRWRKQTSPNKTWNHESTERDFPKHEGDTDEERKKRH